MASPGLGPEVAVAVAEEGAQCGTAMLHHADGNSHLCRQTWAHTQPSRKGGNQHPQLMVTVATSPPDNPTRDAMPLLRPWPTLDEPEAAAQTTNTPQLSFLWPTWTSNLLHLTCQMAASLDIPPVPVFLTMHPVTLTSLPL